MKKNILITTYSIGYGGIENALINMLKNVDYSKYNIDLLLTREDNYYLDELPKEVNVIIKKYIPLKEQFKISLKKFDIINSLKILKIYLLKQVKKENELLIKSMQVENDKEYDYAIAYHSFFQLQYINSINAKKRICYVHCNPYAYRNDIENFLEFYEKSDLIACVSSKVKDRMIEIDNKLAGKTVVMTNIVNTKEIEKLAEDGESFEDNFDGTRILTVGRFTIEKGFGLVIDAIKKLADNNYNFKWYVIGDGAFRNEFEKKLEEYNLQDKCVILGYKKNPYGYMKNCNIYVQPSLDESYCVTTVEAKIFNVPIVRTNTPGSEEQFENMKNGIITEISSEGLYEGITKFLDDEDLKNSVIESLSKENKESNAIDQIAEIEKYLI